MAVGGRQVCQQLDLCVAAGQRWAVLGGNGAGKTTLLHTLAGLRPPAAGRLWLDGRPLEQWSRRHIARRLGLLPQDHEDAFPATVLETALIGRHPYLTGWRWEDDADLAAAAAALAAVGLAGFEARSVQSLSGGERRRLGLATLLTQDPALLLLDEPTNHLDVAHQIALLERLAESVADAGKAWLMVTHDPTLAARFCTHALLLFGNGETVQGDAGLLDEGLLGRLYGCPLVRLAGPHGAVFTPA
ncbi:MAG: ABC transporter ATP-binding protein [Pseudomonadota bacterium]|nr:ABC transporter ATP-binding protein [Pseudomonadota bacterium]